MTDDTPAVAVFDVVPEKKAPFVFCRVNFDELNSVNECNKALIFLTLEINSLFAEIAEAKDNKDASHLELSDMHSDLNNHMLARDLLKERKEEVVRNESRESRKIRLSNRALQDEAVLREIKAIDRSVFDAAFDRAKTANPELFAD